MHVPVGVFVAQTKHMRQVGFYINRGFLVTLLERKLEAVYLEMALLISRINQSIERICLVSDLDACPRERAEAAAAQLHTTRKCLASADNRLPLTQ